MLTALFCEGLGKSMDMRLTGYVAAHSCSRTDGIGNKSTRYRVGRYIHSGTEYQRNHETYPKIADFDDPDT